MGFSMQLIQFGEFILYKTGEDLCRGILEAAGILSGGFDERFNEKSRTSSI